jgi:antirestriction protein ArdC
MCGIEQHTIPNSSAYIQSWIRTFKGDPKVLVIAAAQAQKAVDYILNNRVTELIPEEQELILEPLEM